MTRTEGHKALVVQRRSTREERQANLARSERLKSPVLLQQLTLAAEVIPGATLIDSLSGLPETFPDFLLEGKFPEITTFLLGKLESVSDSQVLEEDQEGKIERTRCATNVIAIEPGQLTRLYTASFIRFEFSVITNSSKSDGYSDSYVEVDTEKEVRNEKHMFGEESPNSFGEILVETRFIPEEDMQQSMANLAARINSK